MTAKDKDTRPAEADNANVQGEGNYEAARRYDKKLQEHVKEHDVDKEARDAEPSSPAEARDLEQAEQKGKQRAKGEDPLLENPDDIDSAEDESPQ